MVGGGVIKKIESENKKVDIFTKGLQGWLFLGLERYYVDGKHSYEKVCIKKWHIHPEMDIYGPKGIFWTDGENSYFGLI